VRPRVVGAAVVVALGATAVQWTGGRMSLLGSVLSLGALACEALFSLLAVPALASLGPLAVSTYACLFAVPQLLFIGLLVDGTRALPALTLGETVALVYLGAVVTALAFVLWYSAVENLGVAQAGLFAGIVPVSALLSTAAIGSSTFTPLRLFGALLVGMGIVAGVTWPRAARPAGRSMRLPVEESR
jgi:drug/metabolite transporter (DMT)-like permease